MAKSKYLVCRPMFGRNRKLKHGEIVTADQLRDLSYCISKKFVVIIDEKDESNISDDSESVESKNEDVSRDFEPLKSEVDESVSDEVDRQENETKTDETSQKPKSTRQKKTARIKPK